jgi:hypothetical protein
MAATGVQINWNPVVFGSTQIQRVNSVTLSQGGNLLTYAGDNNRWPVVVTNNMNNPRITVNSADVATLMSFTPGQSGPNFTATQIDAMAASGGAINWTGANAYHETSDDTGAFSQWAGGTASFLLLSSDGATNPLTISSRT